MLRCIHGTPRAVDYYCAPLCLAVELFSDKGVCFSWLEQILLNRLHYVDYKLHVNW
jgi:hypothetical protein